MTDEKLIRNSKLLIAIAKGAAVVSTKWLEESQKKRALIIEDIKLYHLIDKNFENQYKCKLANLYEGNKCKTLMKDKKVFVSPNVQGAQQMSLMVEAIGGKIIDDMKKSDICIMDPNKDQKNINALKKEKKPPIIASVHLVFDGILA